jgi:hypothetical protein
VIIISVLITLSVAVLIESSYDKITKWIVDTTKSIWPSSNATKIQSLEQEKTHTKSQNLVPGETDSSDETRRRRGWTLTNIRPAPEAASAHKTQEQEKRNTDKVLAITDNSHDPEMGRTDAGNRKLLKTWRRFLDV